MKINPNKYIRIKILNKDPLYYTTYCSVIIFEKELKMGSKLNVTVWMFLDIYKNGTRSKSCNTTYTTSLNMKIGRSFKTLYIKIKIISIVKF